MGRTGFNFMRSIVLFPSTSPAQLYEASDRSGADSFHSFDVEEPYIEPPPRDPLNLPLNLAEALRVTSPLAPAAHVRPPLPLDLVHRIASILSLSAASDPGARIAHLRLRYLCRGAYDLLSPGYFTDFRIEDKNFRHLHRAFEEAFVPWTITHPLPTFRSHFEHITTLTITTCHLLHKVPRCLIAHDSDLLFPKLVDLSLVPCPTHGEPIWTGSRQRTHVPGGHALLDLLKVACRPKTLAVTYAVGPAKDGVPPSKEQRRSSLIAAAGQSLVTAFLPTLEKVSVRDVTHQVLPHAPGVHLEIAFAKDGISKTMTPEQRATQVSSVYVIKVEGVRFPSTPKSVVVRGLVEGVRARQTWWAVPPAPVTNTEWMVRRGVESILTSAHGEDLEPSKVEEVLDSIHFSD